MARKLVSVALSVIIACSLGLVNLVQASKISDYKDSKNNVQSQISDIQSEKSTLQNVLGDKRDKAAAISQLLNKKSAAYNHFKKQLDFIKKAEQALKDDVSAARKEYKGKINQLEKRLRAINENSSFSYLHTVLSASSVVDFVNRIEIVQELVQYDKTLIGEANAAKKDLAHKLAEKKKEKAKMAEDTKAALEELNKVRASQSSINSQIANTQAQLNVLKRREDELEAQARRFDALIKQLQSSSTSKFVGGKFRWPTPGYTTVTSKYGRRFHPIYKEWRMHSGVDIGAPSGVSIVAVGAGKVIQAGWSNGYGNTVVIDHGGGVTTLYAHASKLLVSTGQRVKAGKVIAKVGSTGWSTGPHLHFEVRKNGSTQDPLSGWIK